jgi:hypothetical protein
VDLANCQNLTSPTDSSDEAALWHDGLGMSLYAKRLERGRFIWPSPAGGAISISAAQLSPMCWKKSTGDIRSEPGDRLLLVDLNFSQHFVEDLACTTTEAYGSIVVNPTLDTLQDDVDALNLDFSNASGSGR